MNKDEIDFIIDEMIKLHREGYGTISKCLAQARGSWKIQLRLNYKKALQELYKDVEGGGVK